MIPVIGVSGWHRSGKTTFIVGLIHVLREKQIEVAVIKHTRETPALDHEGTDTWLFAQAGSQFVAIAGPQGSAVLYPAAREPSFWELVAMVPDDVGLIIAEGYRQLEVPRFEVLTEGYPQTPTHLLLAAVYREPSSIPRDLGPGIPILQATEYERAVELLAARGYVTWG